MATDHASNISDVFQTGGSLAGDAPTYVERAADDELHEAILAREFCYVLTSRQMGKSSLRVHTMQRLQNEGFACAAIDITRIGSQQVDATRWYAGLIRSLASSFGLNQKINLRTWLREHEYLTPVQQLGEYIESVLLNEISGPIVIFIDEIDSVLSLQFPADDLFTFIRACYNQRVDNPSYNRLTFVLLGVATPTDLVRDKTRTPFNIGRAIGLSGLELERAKPLIEVLSTRLASPKAVLQRILYWTNGQPFLTQKLCKLISDYGSVEATLVQDSVDELVHQQIICNWEAQDDQEHLRTIQARILDDERKAGRLLGIYQQILQQGQLAFDGSSEQMELRLSGLVKVNQGSLAVYNLIYRHIFDENWVNQALNRLRPYADAIAAWLATNCQDESRLLRGQALIDAQQWTIGKNLSQLDYRFLSASQSLELKAEKEANSLLRKAKQQAEIALAQAREANEEFIEARKRSQEAERRAELALEQERQAKERLNSLEQSVKVRDGTAKPAPQIIIPLVLTIFAVVCLTLSYGQKYLRQPELQVGTLSPHTIIAPENALVIDQQTTDEKRFEARVGAVPVLILDEKINDHIKKSLDGLLRRADTLRSQAGEFPFLASNQLSISTQAYIRSASEAEWNGIWSIVTSLTINAPKNDGRTDKITETLNSRDDFRQLNSQQQPAVQELLQYQQLSSALDIQTLQLVIETARSDFQRASAELQRLSRTERRLPDDAFLFHLSDREWQTVIRQVRWALDRMLLQGIAEGISSDLLATAVNEQLRDTVPNEAQGLAEALVLAVLQPNLIEDAAKTRARAEAAAEQIPEVTVFVQRGDVIVQEGETINQDAFVLLDHFGLSQRRLNYQGLLGFGALLAAATALFWQVKETFTQGLRAKDYLLLFFLFLGIAWLSVFFNIAAYSLPALGLLVSSFYGSVLGVTLVSLLTVLLPVGTHISIVPLLTSAAGGLVCSIVAPRIRTREKLALLAGFVGPLQGAVYFVLTWITSQFALTIWYLPLTGAVVQTLSGTISLAIALGISPFLEVIFGLITPVRLAELTDPSRSLLKRLASERAEVFQQSLIVSNMAETAGRLLKLDTALVRAGSYYYEIGYLGLERDYLLVIDAYKKEPQRLGVRDSNNIILSALNIMHVNNDVIRKGITIARKNRLPTAVINFVSEAKGTILEKRLYLQSLSQTDKTVEPSAFRFKGKHPTSPETALVMLASSTYRMLFEQPENDIKESANLIFELINELWFDQNLSDAGILKEDLETIARIFARVKADTPVAYDSDSMMQS